MSIKKVLLILFATTIIAVLTTIMFHKSILNYYANNKLESMGIPVTLKIKSIGTDHLDLTDIHIGKSNKIEHLKLEFSLEPEFNLTQFDLKVAEYDLEELKSLETGTESGSDSKFQFEHCDKVKNTKFFLDVAGLHSVEVTVTCRENLIQTQIKNIHYEGIGPLHIDLETNVSDDPITSTYSAQLEDDLVSKGSFKYSLQDKEFSAQVDQLDKNLQVAKIIDQLAPKEIKEQILKSSGSFNFNGNVVTASNQLGVDFDIKADNVSFETEDYKAKGVYVRHSLIDYPSMKSKKRQSFKAKEVTVGTTIHDIKVIYDVESQDKVNVNQFELKVDGALVSAKNFKVYPLLKRTGPTKINIDKLSLEKFLKLALGDTATATGELTGHIELRFKNKKPIIESGSLKAKGPGTIQYRPPTSKGPPDPNSYSTDPMEILNNYLYDFHFTDLSVTMSSDENYDMKMTMTALGKNPGYLSGKALKLNVNLEQNLLAAFQAMMLSYNLPKRLEEKISNLGK